MFRQPWLRLKSWTFSDWKTVNSVRDSKWFNEFKDIIIFNQPTWYAHILIKTSNDLINLLKDIYDYHLYYTSYPEYCELLELYYQAKHNIDNNIPTIKNAYNLPKSWSKFKDFITQVKIYFWATPSCNLIYEQITKQIHYIENQYFKERLQRTKLYWDDLLLDYFNFVCLDEAQIYFWSRSWEKNFSWKNEFLKDFISYPVKLNTRLEPIVQNPNMLDINFRRQASTYVLHDSFLLWYIQKTSIIDIKDWEKVNFENANVISKSYRFNFYKLFKFPRVQYYRTYLIKPNDPDIYKPWDYFRHIRRKTDLYNLKHNITSNETTSTNLQTTT